MPRISILLGTWNQNKEGQGQQQERKQKSCLCYHFRLNSGDFVQVCKHAFCLLVAPGRVLDELTPKNHGKKCVY